MFHMHPPQINPCCFVRWPRRFTRRGHSRHGRVPQPGHGRVPPRARAGTAAGMSARQLRTEGPVFSGKGWAHYLGLIYAKGPANS